MVGIYKITNKINNKAYIGQSTDIERRWKQHVAKINNGTELLYQAFRKYGFSNFTFEVIEECTPEQLDDKEIYWSVQFDTLTPNGYNMVGCGNHSFCETNQNARYSSAQIYEIRKRVFVDLEAPAKVLKDCEKWGMGRTYFYLLLHGDFRQEEGSGIELVYSLRCVGESNPRATLSNQEVLQIRNRVHVNKEPQLVVFQDYKDCISFQAFSKIVKGETWKNVDCSMIQEQKVQRKGQSKAKISKEEVGYIRYRHEVLGESWTEIYKDYNDRVTPVTIKRIVNYETWKNVKPVSTIPEA